MKQTGLVADPITPAGKRRWSYDATFHVLAAHQQSPWLTADYKYADRLDELLKTETDKSRLATFT